MKRRISAREFFKLSDSVRADYAEMADGSGYELQLVGPDGQPEPVEDTPGLKSAFEKAKEERDRHRELLRQVREANAAEKPDPALIKVLEQQLADSEARSAAYDAEKKAELDDMHAHYKVQFAVLDERRNKALTEGDEAVLGHELVKAIVAARGIVTFLEPKLRKFCRVIRDEADEIGTTRRVAVFDDDGNMRINPTTGQPITVETALLELKTFDPTLARFAFEQPDNGNGNGGAQH